MLQKKMEGMTMIVVTQVAKLVQEDIVLQHFRQTDYIQVQIDIVPRRAASPVG